MIIDYVKSDKIIEYVESDGTCTIFHKQSVREISLGTMEYDFLCSLDGKCDSQKVLNKYPELCEADLKLLLKVFWDKGLLKGSEKKKKFTILNFNMLSIKAKNCKITSVIKKQFINLWFYGAFFVFAIVLFLLITNFNNIYQLVKEYLDNITSVKMMVISLSIILSFIVHEKSHAIMANMVGVHVAQYNIGFVSLLPCVSTVFCGVNKNKSDNDILKIELAGISANLWLFSISFIIFLYFRLMQAIPLFLFNLALAFFNLIFLLKTDGQQIILTILGMGDINLSLFRRFIQCYEQKKYNEVIFVLYIYLIFMVNVLFINMILINL